MANTYIKELQEKIEILEDGFSIKELEITLIQNELVDTLAPSIATDKMLLFVLQMLMELNEYEQKNKLSARMLASKKRLGDMLGLSVDLHKITVNMHSLKLFNREIVTKIQLLRVENSDLRKKIDKMTKAEEY